MVDFLIDHLDPLGQGVSKRITPQKKSAITFIPKTLPGETGSAKVIKSAKGVEFAELEKLTKSSEKRIAPECPHYSQCSGCDYLHVSYADELAYKKAALLFLMRSFALEEKDIEVIQAPKRFGYRNRVQLHYRHKYIGLIDANSDRILEVPQCQILREELRPELANLYADKSWSSTHKGGEGKNKDGHCEISLRDGKPLIEWDAPYASGGFTQVNDEMNLLLKMWIKNRFFAESYTHILDLFSGCGNLSDMLLDASSTSRVMVDAHNSTIEYSERSQFFKYDLFSEDALERFFPRIKKNPVDIMLLDPPRKGFPALEAWYKKIKPKYIVYVSCNPATLSRDLKDLLEKHTSLKIKDVVLLDMFPGTRHFETIVVLKS